LSISQLTLVFRLYLQLQTPYWHTYIPAFLEGECSCHRERGLCGWRGVDCEIAVTQIHLKIDRFYPCCFLCHSLSIAVFRSSKKGEVNSKNILYNYIIRRLLCYSPPVFLTFLSVPVTTKYTFFFNLLLKAYAFPVLFFFQACQEIICII